MLHFSRVLRCLATLLALTSLLIAAGCGQVLHLRPVAPRTQNFEQTRQISLALLGMTFQTAENVKYRERLASVHNGSLELVFTPLEYTVTSTQGIGRNEIYGTSLLKQPGETPEVTMLREFGQHDVRVRTARGGAVENIATDYAPEGENRPFQRDLQEKALHLALEHVFINTHIMMTQSVLPDGEVRVGESYRPAGTVFEESEDKNIKLMKVEKIDKAGVATLLVDHKAIEKMFVNATSGMQMPKELNVDVSFSGEGDGVFHFDTKRHCITDGKVSLLAKAKMSGENAGNLMGGLSMRIDITLKEIPSKDRGNSI